MTGMDSAFFEETPGRPQPWGAGPEPEPPPAEPEPPAREPVFNAPWPAVLVAALIVGGFAVQGFLPDAVVAPLVFSPSDLTHGRGWTALTAIFLHGSWAHAFMNGAFALAFGTPAARYFGERARGVACFFGFYVLTGVLANLGYAALHWGSAAGLIGASGSVSGLMGAAARLIAGRGRLGPIFSGPALSFAAALFAVNLLVALFGGALAPMTGGAGIAWEAHIAGFVAGVLLIGPFAWLAWRR
jgi:membrane associated rhomboid family serine protease